MRLLGVKLFGLESDLGWKNFSRMLLFFPEVDLLPVSLNDCRVGPDHLLFMVLFVAPLDILLDDSVIDAIPIYQLAQQMLIFLLVGQ